MTKHQQRIIAVRKRMNEAIKYVPKEVRRGGFSAYGSFAEKMCAIAKERDVWPWRQTALSTNGVPKDIPTSLRGFAEGKHGTQEAILNLIELTCLHYEIEHKRAIGEASGVAFTGATEWPAENDPVSASLLNGAEAEKVVQAVTVDPELHAIETIHELCDNLDGAAIKRVLLWVAARHGVPLA